MSSPAEVAALIRAIARGELPAAKPPKKPRAKRRYFPKAHPGSPVDVVDLELAEVEKVEARRARNEATDFEGRIDGLIREAAELEARPVSELTQRIRDEQGPMPSKAAQVVAFLGSQGPELQVIRATAAAVEQKRIQAEQLAAELTRQRSQGNWKKQCTARDAETGLRCGQLEGHLVATASRKATPHTTPRGSFVRCLQEGGEASRSRELEQWAQDRRDVGDVSP